MTTALLAVWLAGSAAAASAPAPKPQLPGEPIELRTADGWTLKAVFKPAEPGKMTAVLLHGRGTRKEWWLRLARALVKNGYGMLAVDLRGHGDSNIAPDGSAVAWRKLKASRAENDYEAMGNDVNAAVARLNEATVSEDQIALIGQDVGGSVALKYAAVHPKIGLLVMLSPGLKYQEVTTVNAMRAYKNRPVLLVYGEQDKVSKNEAPILFQFAKMSVGADKAAVISVPNVMGAKLLSGAVVSQIVAWLGNPVPPAPPETSTDTAPGAPPPLPAAPGGLEPSPEDAEETDQVR